jgi:hypothetical protein
MSTARLDQRCLPKSGIVADSQNVDMLHNTTRDVANGFHTMGQNENMPTVVQLQFRMRATPS